MSSSFISDSDLPSELNSETPFRCLNYAKKENAAISEENEIYSNQIKNLKEQLQRALDINKNYDALLLEKEKLNEIILNLQQEKEDLGHRLKIAINSQQQAAEEHKHNIFDLEQTILPMKQKYESQIKQLKFQCLQLQENHDTLNSEYDILKLQIKNLLSLASDLYGQAFLTIPSLGEFLNYIEEARKKQKIEYESQMQDEMAKLQDKLSILKAKYHAHKEASTESIKSLSAQISQIQEIAKEPSQKLSTPSPAFERSSTPQTPMQISAVSHLTEKSQKIPPQTPALPSSSDSGFKRSGNYEIPSPQASPSPAQTYITPTTSEIFSAQPNYDNVSEIVQQLESAQSMKNALMDELAMERARSLNLQHELEQVKSVRSSMSTPNLSIMSINERKVEDAKSDIAKSEIMRSDDERRKLEFEKNAYQEKQRELENNLNNARRELDRQREFESNAQRELQRMRDLDAENLSIAKQELEKQRKEFQEKQTELENNLDKAKQELSKQKDIETELSDVKKSLEKEKKSHQEEITHLKEDVEEKHKKLLEAVSTIKTLQLKLKQAQAKIKKQVTFVQPINWTNLHLSQDFINELLPKFTDAKMTDRDKLEMAIVMLVDRYRDKIQKIVDESVAKTNQMKEQIKTVLGNIFQSDEENTNFGKLIEVLKSLINNFNTLKNNAEKTCQAIGVKNISDIYRIFEKLSMQKNKIQEELNNVIRSCNEMKLTIEQKNSQIIQITNEKSIEISNLNIQVNHLTEIIDDNKNTISKLNDILEGNIKTIDELKNSKLEDEKTKAKMEVQNLQLSNEISDFKATIKRLNDEMQNQSSKFSIEMSKLEKEKEEYFAKVRTQKDEDEKSFNKTIQDLQNQINALNDALRKAQSDFELEKRNKEFTVQNIDSLRKYIEKLRKTRQKLKRKNKVLQQTLDEVRTESKQTEEDLKQDLVNMERQFMSRIRAQTDEYKSSMSGLQREVERLHFENETVKSSNTDLTVRLQRAEMARNAQVLELQRDKRQIESQMRAQLMISNVQSTHTRIFSSVRGE